jgi:hypothetical protein
MKNQSLKQIAMINWIRCSLTFLITLYTFYLGCTQEVSGNSGSDISKLNLNLPPRMLVVEADITNQAFGLPLIELSCNIKRKFKKGEWLYGLQLNYENHSDEATPESNREVNEDKLVISQEYTVFGVYVPFELKPPPTLYFENHYQLPSITLNTGYRLPCSNSKGKHLKGWYFDFKLALEFFSFYKNVTAFTGNMTRIKREVISSTYVRDTYHFDGTWETVNSTVTQFILIPTIGFGYRFFLGNSPFSSNMGISIGKRINFYDSKPYFYKAFNSNAYWSIGYCFGRSKQTRTE